MTTPSHAEALPPWTRRRFAVSAAGRRREVIFLIYDIFYRQPNFRLIDDPRFRAALEDLRPGMEALLEIAAPDVAGGGSNNWALSPTRTATGRPLLAGDAHRVLESPNMYVQQHLACDEFDAIGLTVPGVPAFPHFAHSESVAWSVTHAFVDIHDLFVERFREEGRACLFKGAWEPVRSRREEICVKGEAPRGLDVIETRHGPIIAGDPARARASRCARLNSRRSTTHSIRCCR
jgi:penicillin amidase